MNDTKIEAVSVKAGDRVVFKDPESGRRVARKVLAVDLDGDTVEMEFQAGRGRWVFRCSRDTMVTIPTQKRGGTGRYVLA